MKRIKVYSRIAWNKGLKDPNHHKIINCIICNNSFETFKSSNQKFCSQKCYLNHRSKIFSGEKNPMWIDGRLFNLKKCERCNKEFKGFYSNQRYCSRKCFGDAYKNYIHIKKRYTPFSKSLVRKHHREMWANKEYRDKVLFNSDNKMRDKKCEICGNQLIGRFKRLCSKKCSIIHFNRLEKIRENGRRAKLGLPLIGQGFKKEMEVLFYLSYLFKGYEIRQHDRTTLRIPGEIAQTTLELDFYIPKFKLAFEYMGKQHYDEELWNNLKNGIGSSSTFQEQIFRDRIKRRLCRIYGIKLIRIKYNEKLSEQLLLSKLKFFGINSIQLNLSNDEQYNNKILENNKMHSL